MEDDQQSPPSPEAMDVSPDTVVFGSSPDDESEEEDVAFWKRKNIYHVSSYSSIMDDPEAFMNEENVVVVAANVLDEDLVMEDSPLPRTESLPDPLAALYHEGVRSEASLRLREVSGAANFELAGLDPRYCAPGLYIAPIPRGTVSVRSDDGLYSSVFADKPLVVGRVTYFEGSFRRSVGGSSFCVGFGPRSMGLTKLLGKDPMSFGVHSSGQSICAGVWTPVVDKGRIVDDTIVGLGVLIEEGTQKVFVKMFIDGERVGENVNFTEQQAGELAMKGTCVAVLPRDVTLFPCMTLKKKDSVCMLRMHDIILVEALACDEELRAMGDPVYSIAGEALTYF
eukprot:TRINITY_DN27379_c0_g1_i1.p1 TRINITY_DN27379_c0_g1~~TRINITY_DN27379_c0_g1_i1.p1  ORF type:complete len:339 (-),score=78.15 TRINITY_DN27379_c0_g1_i1:339-1355(-)